MARSQQSLSEESIARRIKDGRGQGVGKFYKPWLYVHEVPSQGRSHRVYSHKTKRIHHLLSDLELAVFHLLEWSPAVVDIREQFPLRLDETQHVALEHHLKHPCIRGVDQVMSSDFLVDLKKGTERQYVIQVKPSDQLVDPRTIEKLEIERRYWQSKQIPWYLVTELEIDQSVKQNIDWLYPTKTDSPLDASLLNQLPLLRKLFHQEPNAKIIDICKKIDRVHHLDLGETLRDVRILIANGFLKFNIQQAFRKLSASDVIFCVLHDMEGLLRVENQ